MEGVPHNKESFANFKSAIYEIYQMDGWSEKLNSLIGVWHTQRQQETDLRGGTIEERVVFQIELAEIYIITEQHNKALATLDDALTQAMQENLPGLEQKIEDLIGQIS